MDEWSNVEFWPKYATALASHLCLNVQDIIKERTKEKSYNVSSTFILSTTIAGGGQHPFNTCQ